MSDSKAKESFAGILILCTHCGSYILQDRDDKPGINDPGMAGLFGGYVDQADLGFDQAAVRELKEETNLEFVHEDIKLLTEINNFGGGIIDPYILKVFLLKASSCDFEVYEGTGKVKVPSSKPDLKEYNLAPSAFYILNSITQWNGGRYE